MMRGRTRERWVGAGFSLAAHLVILLALMWAWATKPEPEPPAPAEVALVDLPLAARAAPRAAPTKPAEAAPSSPAAAPTHTRTPAPAQRPAADSPPAHEQTLAASDLPEAGGAGQAGAGVSDAALAGAADADGGAGGGACDMARRLRDALRRDPLVQTAVAQAAMAQGGRDAGRPLLVWNGGWIQSDGEDGKGLAAVREAIAWEVAFAPPACRAQAVRGLVLISLNDARTARVVLGAPAWRWSDLLALR